MLAALGQRLGEARAPDTGCTLCDLDECLKLFVVAFRQVVILTTFEQDDYIFGALSAGASGFLLKRTAPEELVVAIHTIAAGDSLLSPSVTSRVIERMASQPAPDSAPRRAPRRAHAARA